MTREKFDYPYPYSEDQEREAERVSAQRERKQRVEEVQTKAALVVRALGSKGKPEWGAQLREAVLQAIRQSLPTGTTPMDVDRFEDALKEIAGGHPLAATRAAGQLLDERDRLWALDQAAKVVRVARSR